MSEEIRWPESYDEEDKQHSLWWSEQMQKARSTITDIQDKIARNSSVEIAGSHTSLDQDGEHEVRISLIFKGESFEEFKDGNSDLDDKNGDKQ